MNKKGNVMVEASLVFPVVILTVIAVIHILLFFFQQTELRTQMHLALRAENGRYSGAMIYEKNVEMPFPIYKEALHFCSYGTVKFSKQGILESSAAEIEASVYCFDAVNFVRFTDFVDLGKGRPDE